MAAVAAPSRSAPRRLRAPRMSGDDRQLADGLRRRDPAALAAPARRVRPHRARASSCARCGDRASAEDVFQQVFLEAWQRGPAYDPGRAAPLTWLHDASPARARSTSSAAACPSRATRPARSRCSRARPIPAADVDALVEQWRFAHLLGRLPDEEADVLRRRFYGGRSQREIAAATGIPLGTVKMRMVQALARLRELIEEEEAR